MSWNDAPTEYDFDFTSAYYESTTEAFFAAVNTIDSQSYIIHYYFDDPNIAPSLYPLKGFSEDPSVATGYVGNPHTDSIIYAAQKDSNGDVVTTDFPVKGYLVGSASTIWTYNKCQAPDFGRIDPTYDQLFNAPGAGLAMGIISKIERDVYSCNSNLVSFYNAANGVSNTAVFNVDSLNVSAETFNGSGEQETSVAVPSVVTDLSSASTTPIALGAWEAS